ncbi:pilin [Actinospica robiniae]|uniref:pilin n=1 Tax=Actinospica robiniae TaxID=304901 RepID=UPI00040494C5|nr:pilin [Actinospica robiniae]
MPRNPSAPRRLPRLKALLTVATGALALTVLAATPALADTDVSVLAAADIPTVITNLQNWLIGILAALATLFLVLGGIRYVISNGNPGEVEKAKTAFKSAAIGYCLAILAPVVITILKGIVGG